MISILRADNFKSWKSTGNIRLAPLTGLFGANSSGKTSILQILLMLKQTVESPDRSRVLHTGDDYSIVDLGTFLDLMYGHDKGASVQLSFSWTLPEPLVINDPDAENQELFNVKKLSFSAEIRELTGRTTLDKFTYEFDSHSFGMVRKAAGKGADKDRYDLDHGDYPTRRVPGRVWPLPPPVKCYGFPDEATRYYQNTGFLPDFVLAFEKMLKSVLYLGPLREDPKRSYLWSGERPLDVGVRGDEAVAALLAARGAELRSGRMVNKRRRYKSVEERVLEWMQEMRLIHSFSLEPIAANRKDYEFRVKRSKNSTEVLITDVGFGVSQILPVLVLCYYAPENSTILLEHPEIHLHPSVQAGLADVLIDVVKERNVQVIVESHSEHLLRRLQRRIAEYQVSDKGISREMTALYFCKTENGDSHIETLDMDAFGNIKNWPSGFFGDEIGELTAMAEANIKRQEVKA
jgi:predicted ATPase